MELKIGQRVWFETQYSPILKGTIEKIFHDESSGKEFAHITDVTSAYHNFRFSPIDVEVSKLATSLESYQKRKKEQNDKIQNEYRAKIQSVEDLVRITFKNPCNAAEEYTDWLLREVVIEKAKELLNIDLEKED